MTDPIRDAREELVSHGLLSAPLYTGKVSEAVERSWRRSLGNLVSSTDTPEYLHKFDPESLFRRAALPVMERWKDQLAGTGSTLFLSDRSGQIIARKSGDKAELNRLDSVYAAEGFNYSEEDIGTNALGTSLAEKAAVFIRGSEHFIDMLQVNACAAVPVFAPNGSAIGSIALSSPNTSASPLMLSLAKEVGQQIEGNLRTASSPQDLAVAMSFMRYGSSDIATVVMDQETILANTAGLPYVTVETHVMLWNLFQEHDWTRFPRFQKDINATGVAVDAIRIGRHSKVHFVVRFSELAVSAPASPIGEAFLPASASSSTNGFTHLIAGPSGSGRFTKFKELKGPRHTEVETFWLDAEPQKELKRIESTLADDQDVLLRGVDELDGDAANDLGRIIRVHEQLARSGSRNNTIWITARVQNISPALSSALGSIKNVTELKPLNTQSEQLPHLIREVLYDIDESETHTLSPKALQALIRWHWPRNIAELVEVLESALSEASGNLIELRHLPKYIQNAYQQRGKSMIENAEHLAILDALTAAEGNKSRAAELLGLGRTTLYRKMRQYHIRGDGQST